MAGTPDTHPQIEMTQSFTCTPKKCAVFAYLNWKKSLKSLISVTPLPEVRLCLHQHRIIDFHPSEGGCGDSFTSIATISKEKMD